MLEKAVGKFLRTHRGGGRRLLDWMDSVPSDRTEEQCRAEREAADTAHKVTVARSIAKVNAERAAAGCLPLAQTEMPHIDLMQIATTGPNAWPHSSNSRSP